MPSALTMAAAYEELRRSSRGRGLAGLELEMRLRRVISALLGVT